MQQKDNTGVLRKNKRKERPTHADCTGSATIDGVRYWLSGWTNTDEEGEKWLKLSFKKMAIQDFQSAETARAEHGSP